MSDDITLREYIEQQIALHESRNVERFAAWDKALSIAQTAQTDYNQRTNEFRSSLADLSKLMITRAEGDVAARTIEEKIAALQSLTEFNRAEIEQRLRRDDYDKRHDLLVDQIKNLDLSRATLAGKADQSAVTSATLLAGIGILLAAVGLAIEFLH